MTITDRNHMPLQVEKGHDGTQIVVVVRHGPKTSRTFSLAEWAALDAAARNVLAGCQ